MFSAVVRLVSRKAFEFSKFSRDVADERNISTSSFHHKCSTARCKSNSSRPDKGRRRLRRYMGPRIVKQDFTDEQLRLLWSVNLLGERQKNTVVKIILNRIFQERDVPLNSLQQVQRAVATGSLQLYPEEKERWEDFVSDCKIRGIKLRNKNFSCTF